MQSKILEKIYNSLGDKTSILKSHLPEARLAEFIRNELKKRKDHSITAQEELEIASLSFHPDYSNSNSDWDSYYGPQWVLPVDGVMKEFPSIRGITKDSINYWELRIESNAHPILKARYSDLILEFSQRILKSKPAYKVYLTHLDSVIELLKQGKLMNLDLIRLGKRAYYHSLAISNTSKAQELIELLIKLEDKEFDIDKPGLWGFTLETFYIENPKKSILSEEQLLDRVKKLEKVLVDTKNINPIDAATYHLMQYYAIRKDQDNLIRIIEILESAYRNDMRMNSEPLLHIHYLEKLRDIYIQYESQFPKAKEGALRLLNEISNLDLDWEKSMKKFSTEFKIDVNKIREGLNPLFDIPSSENTLPIIISNLARAFLPKEQNLREELDKSIKQHAIKYLITTQIIASDGTPLAKLSSIDLEYEFYFKRFVSDQLTYDSIVLSIALEILKEKFSTDEIIEHLSSQILFVDIKETLNRALGHYYKKNYLEFSYLIIPCIENAVRKLAKLSGRTILKPNAQINGGFKRKLLSELLRDKELFDAVYGKISNNVQFYFKLVLTEQLGMNLRNDFAHGFEPKKFMNKNTAERLLHLLLCLSIITKNKKD